MTIKWMVIAVVAAVSVKGVAAEGILGLDSEHTKFLQSNTGRVFCTSNGHTQPGTGFVILTKDGTKVIVTAAHVSPAGPNALFEYLPYGESDRIACYCMAIESKRDIMLLKATRPLKAAGIELPANVNSLNLMLRDKVILLGSASGIEISVEEGIIDNDTLSGHELIKDARIAGWDGTLHVDGDTELIRHATRSHPACSGGPLFDSTGRLIGVQLGALVNANGQEIFGKCVGVNAKYISNIDLTRPLADDNAPRHDSTAVVMPHSGTKQTVRLNGMEFDVRCRIFRNLPKAYDDVLRRYVADDVGFRKHVSEKELNGVFSGLGLAYCRNDMFGFSFIAPRGNQLTTSVSQRPGVRVEIADEEVTIANIHVLLVRDYVEAAERSATMQLLEDGFTLAADDSVSRHREYYMLVSHFAFTSISHELVTRLVYDRGRDNASIVRFEAPLVEPEGVIANGRLVIGGKPRGVTVFISSTVAGIIEFTDDVDSGQALAQRIIRFSFDLQ